MIVMPTAFPHVKLTGRVEAWDGPNPPDYPSWRKFFLLIAGSRVGTLPVGISVRAEIASAIRPGPAAAAEAVEWRGNQAFVRKTSVEADRAGGCP